MSVNRALCHQAVHIDNALLANAMSTVHRLQVLHGVPVMLHKNYLKSSVEQTLLLHQDLPKKYH
ncbi:hypothetical protein E2C01_000691 [Portunus trituberculatus]|uniref:Uncharacterized protein n=1 Tax=Portunus trituberculatus TaxID=210409 RepID=A0A5B7CIA5_PORTR|nr:hypothetical protein [Portunus trituberculatus]